LLLQVRFLGLVHGEELLDDVLPVHEVLIVLLKPQLDVQVVIFVVSQAKSISFKRISV